MYFKGLQVNFSKYVFVLANSADPNEMEHYAAFHQGLHCSPKYLFRVFLQYTMS